MLFARYAFPPNHLGYCGPDDAAGFLRHGAAGNDDGLRRMAGDFDGALPFLTMLAEALGRDDRLDREVVEAYWIGSPELDRAAADGPGAEALRGRCGPLFDDWSQARAAGARPHHSFTVFGIYPWVGMLGDPRRTPQALKVLDRCRIRWGRVLDVGADELRAESRPLVWDGGRLVLGDPVVETVRTAVDGLGLASPVRPGDLVALHWDWVCDVVTPEQQAALERWSAGQLAVVNARLAERTAVAR